MGLFDFNHPFFKPLWLRIAIVVVCLGWGAFEFVAGAAFWGTVFCAVGALAAYGFFVTFAPREPDDTQDDGN